MAQRRTASDLLAASEARTASLKAQVALDEAKSNPEFAPIVDMLESQQTARTANKVGFSTGANSFANRIAAKMNWVAEIQAQRDLAQAQDDYLDSVIEYCQTSLTNCVAGDMDVDDFEIPEPSDEIAELEQAAIDAKDSRIEFSKEMKKPKKAKKVLAEQSEENVEESEGDEDGEAQYFEA